MNPKLRWLHNQLLVKVAIGQASATRNLRHRYYKVQSYASQTGGCDILR